MRHGCGTMFELTPNSGRRPGRKRCSIASRAAKSGGNPEGTPIFDVAGNLYGTTLDGGPYGAGNVFELTPGSDGKWTERVIHEFTGKDGSASWRGVIFDANGNLYGRRVRRAVGSRLWHCL